MNKLLNGRELAEYIKQRQSKDVRSLVQAQGIRPKLAIIQLKDDPTINVYVNLKKKYGAEIGIDVDIYRIEQKDARDKIKVLNSDDKVHGIIIQLPIENEEETDEIIDLVSPDKDVDALAKSTKFDPATPTAILWLLAGYNVDLRNKKILLVGKGKLVGAPLYKMLLDSGLSVKVADKTTGDLKKECLESEIIVTATGKPGLIDSSMISPKTVVIDAGVASEKSGTVGDLDADVYERSDLIITPSKGGVGPLTVCALFENVLKATRASI
jgi:methylenetetrahydrofolate dehydrogenase (NADP+)/methenyltetrahydrofolate cyclohydrolase